MARQSVAANTRRPASTTPGNAASSHFDLSSTAPQTTAREFGHAKRVAERGQKVVSKMFIEARLGKAIGARLIEPVIEDIFASVQRNPHAFNGLMRCKRGSEYAYHHALAVSALMISLGRKMKLPPGQLRDAGQAGLLIDVGIGHLPIDLDALRGDYRKVGPVVLWSHPGLGHDQLIAGGIADAVALACLEHHERMDGSGYPQGLPGANISLFGRMAAICDVYDELVNDFDGGPGLNPAAAIQQMSAMPGAFDPEIMSHFIDALGIYPIGSVVLLRSGRLAMVVDQGPSDPALPKVRTFYATQTGKLTAPAEIRLWNCYGEDAIEAGATPEAFGIEDFARLREKLFAHACAG